MLAVNSAAFYRKVTTSQKTGQINFHGRYDHLAFHKYPVPAQMLSLAVDYHAIGQVDGLYLIRVNLDGTEIHRTAVRPLRIDGARTGRDVGMVHNIEDIAFDLPGVYIFEIVFDDVVLHSVPLTLS